MSDFLCDAFGWTCADHGEFVTRNAAPEIDATALLLALVLVVGGCLIARSSHARR